MQTVGRPGALNRTQYVTILYYIKYKYSNAVQLSPKMGKLINGRAARHATQINNTQR